MCAVKAKVSEPIIGWNFVKKYRLDLQWTEFGDIMLHDKKAKISTPLHYSSIPHGSCPSFKSPTSNDNVENSLFEINSVKQFQIPQQFVTAN